MKRFLRSTLIALLLAALTLPLIPAQPVLAASLDIPVAAATDDIVVYWNGAAWVSDINGAYHSVGYFGAANLKYGGGMRFLNLPIPQGSVITTAYLQIEARTTTADVVVNSVIIGEDVDSAATFVDLADYQARRGAVVGGGAGTMTAASVNWNGMPAWVAGVTYDSPEIKTIIQEIVDRVGWVSGNDMAIFWDDHAATGDQVANHYRQGKSWDMAPAVATSIHIEWEEGPVVQTDPATSVEDTTATLEGQLTDLDGEDPLYVYFQWGESVAYEHGDTVEQERSAIGAFEQNIDELVSGETYHFRAVGRYDGLNYTYGIDRTFTTISGGDIAISVAAADDDCYAYWDGGAWQFILNAVLSQPVSGYYDATHQKMHGGMRFQNVPIPNGTAITEAHISIRAPYPDAGNLTSLIEGEDEDTTVAFTNYANFDGRNKTTASVNWVHDAEPFVVLNWYDSPDIKAIIQEIVDRPGWVAGNDIVIFWGDATAVAGGRRTSYSFEMGAGSAAVLNITFGISAVETNAATDIEDTQANLHGNILTGDPGSVDERGFEWSKVGQFQITVDTAKHVQYGLSYPATYKFSIPVDASSITVLARKTSNGAWDSLPVKTTGDFFNGIEAVRFDYVNNFAYVSVSFGVGDNINLVFLEADGSLLTGVAFVDITEYYDDRQAVVSLTADDFHGYGFDEGLANLLASMDAALEYDLWMSIGIVVYRPEIGLWSNEDIALYQTYINNPNIEIANHSWNHVNTPYADADLEVSGARDYILDNWDLPDLYKRGDQEYLWLWIRPGGDVDAGAWAAMRTANVLIDRGLGGGQYNLSPWDVGEDLYMTQRSQSLDTADLATLNAGFDSRYASGEVHLLTMHPRSVTAGPGTKLNLHFEYISGYTDIWYVGLGSLYAYHYIEERGMVSVTSPTAYSTMWTEGGSFGMGAFEHTIIGLTPGVGYIFRAKAHNASGWGYGEERFFIATLLVPPAVSTGTAVTITRESAIIQGTLNTLGDYTPVYVYFEYGLSTSYGSLGSPTADQTTEDAGGFNVEIDGLSTDTIYHFRVVVRYGIVQHAYGGDRTFTTTTAGEPGIDDPEPFRIDDIKVFTNYLEPGDQLYVIAYRIVYETGTPTLDITDYFDFQLLDGATLKGQWPVKMWDYRPGSIYLSADSTPAWGGSYRVKIIGVPDKWDVPPETYRDLTPGDWQDTGLTQLDTWVISLADSFQSYYNIQYVIRSGSQTYLSSEGGARFIMGIPGLNMIRPDLFSPVWSGYPDPELEEYEETLIDTEARTGSYIFGLFETGADFFNMEAQSFGGIMFGIGYFLMAIVIGAMIGNGLVGMGVATPILITGVWFGLVPAALIAIVAGIFVVYAGVIIWMRGQ